MPTLPVIEEAKDELCETEKVKRVLSEEQKQKMQKGRENARAQKLKGKVAKVNI
jgi:hypothetical protein